MINAQVKLRVPVSRKDHSQGTKEGYLILVEYGDYQCSHCGRAHDAIKRLQQALRDDLQFVFRNFPIAQSHPNAHDAARAAEAAALQGKFWEMHDMLYENQDSLDRESLYAYAGVLELDVDQFTDDMANPYLDERISSDMESGVRSGVNGTPTFFINGFRYDGDPSYERLLQALQSLRHAVTR